MFVFHFSSKNNGGLWKNERGVRIRTPREEIAKIE